MATLGPPLGFKWMVFLFPGTIPSSSDVHIYTLVIFLEKERVSLLEFSRIEGH